MDDKQPEGFTLDGELSREADAALGGIQVRDDVPEVDVDSPVNGVSGDADGGDDHVVAVTDDPDDDRLSDDI